MDNEHNFVILSLLMDVDLGGIAAGYPPDLATIYCFVTLVHGLKLLFSGIIWGVLYSCDRYQFESFLSPRVKHLYLGSVTLVVPVTWYRLSHSLIDSDVFHSV